jgi:hypothetical protein
MRKQLENASSAVQSVDKAIARLAYRLRTIGQHVPA